jgi:hypothetical protein
MLQQILKTVIETKAMELVDLILKEHPNVPRAELLRKAKLLKLLAFEESRNLLKSLSEKKETLKVAKKQNGNYVVQIDEDEKLVLDLNTKLILGFETEEGTVEQLNKHLIEICHKYKLKYVMPSNLCSVLEYFPGGRHCKTLEDELGLEKACDFSEEESGSEKE